MWCPELTDRQGPKYRRILDALAEDVADGNLVAGERLPTHRELAWNLGVTVGTVTRAYVEAERRGLIVGEVGRGSFVRGHPSAGANLALPGDGVAAAIDFAINRPPADAVADVVGETLRELASESPDVARELMTYHSGGGLLRHRASMTLWLKSRGLDVSEDRVLITNGAEHAISASLLTFAEPTGSLLIERLTWSGARALASLFRQKLRPIEMDDQGMLPDALAAAAQAGDGRVVYLQPTVQNPTTAVMGETRLREIADVARRHDLILIEDDVYGLVEAPKSPPLAAFAPERTIYVTSASKSVSPGLRVGLAVMPIGFASSVSRCCAGAQFHGAAGTGRGAVQMDRGRYGRGGDRPDSARSGGAAAGGG